MSEVTTQPWLERRDGFSWAYVVTSVCVHLCLVGALFLFLKKEHVTTAERQESAPKPVRIHFQDPTKHTHKSAPEIAKEQKNTQKTLTATTNHNTKIKSVASKPAIKVPMKEKQKAAHTRQASQRASQTQERIQGDGGDIPFVQDDLLTPRVGPRIIAKHEHKDMTLFQFSAEFRRKFGIIWNQKDRMVPPASPLRPGNVVFYKVYINSDGSLLKYVDLSAKETPNKDYSSLDDIFADVITQTLPIRVPPSFTSSKILTEVIAIQVIDRSSPVMMRFQ